jgi:ribosomal protein S18 acetylase RimI-like enzyme
MGNREIVVRAAVPTDLPAMLRLWREMMDYHAAADPRFRPKPSPDGELAWERFIGEHAWSDDNWCVLVAVEGHSLVGHVVGALREPYPVYTGGRYGVVLDMVVARSARRRGIGQALFAALKEWFIGRGAEHIEMSVAHRNAASQAFWRAMGCADYMDRLWYELEAC